MADERCPHCAGAVLRTQSVCPHCGKGLGGRALLAAGPHSTPISTGATILLVFAFLVAGAGVVSLGTATTGVGLIAGAALLAIWARILQSGAHHQEAMRAVKELSEQIRRSDGQSQTSAG